MQEIEISQCLFLLYARQDCQSSQSGKTFLPCLGLSSKSYLWNSISLIFLKLPHQVDMKNSVNPVWHGVGKQEKMLIFRATKGHKT